MIAAAVFRAIKNGDIHQPQSNEWTGVKNSKENRLETGYPQICLGVNRQCSHHPLLVLEPMLQRDTALFLS